MAEEIERRFLVQGLSWQTFVRASALLRQGYICADAERTVRVRVLHETYPPARAASAFLTVKGRTRGITRAEYEYAIPVDDACILLDTLCGERLIEKERHTVLYDGLVWVVDVFLGANAGLVLTELELACEEQPFTKPPWLGEDVTHDARYANACLAQRPFQSESALE